MSSDSVETVGSYHPWKVRLCIALVMLILSFIGLVLTDMKQDGGWHYWRIIAPVFAILSLALSWYHRKKGLRVVAWTVWHEIFHWIGLILAIYLVSYFVHVGIMGRFVASLQVLTLLALTTFLAGVYFEPTFCVIGLIIGLFGAGVAFINVYIYAVMIPVSVLAIGFIYWIVRKKNHQA